LFFLEKQNISDHSVLNLGQNFKVVFVDLHFYTRQEATPAGLAGSHPLLAREPERKRKPVFSNTIQFRVQMNKSQTIVVQTGVFQRVATRHGLSEV
jgi:hypothetical protein